MPHKRAKMSERVADRAKKGHDLPPSNDSHFHSMPKGAMRILNAAKVQADYREKKRQRAMEEAKKAKGKGKGKAEETSLQIKDGEKMADFHRRVESTMAKDVNSSIRATRDSKKKRKRKGQAQEGEEESHSGEAPRSPASKSKKVPKEPDSKTLKREREALETGKGKETDWEKAATRKRFNDVVEAPPSLTTAPRGKTKVARERKAKLQAALAGTDGSKGLPAEPTPARLPDPIQRGGLRREAVLQEERQRVISAYRQNKQARLDGRS